MNLPLLFARRYLLAKRSSNAINVITGISIAVIAVVTGAMVTVLSAVNGIADLVDTIYSPFDQDITISAAQGKTFERDTLDLAAILALPQVKQASWVIEENVLLQHGDQQAVATLKGVEENYLAMSGMERFMYMGDPVLQRGGEPMALAGIALKVDLDLPLDDGIFKPLRISAPIRGRKLSTYQQRAFETEQLALSGAFSMNTEFDAKYVLVPLELAADLLQYKQAVSALEVQLQPGTSLDRTASTLRTMLGDHLLVRTRYQKNELMYRTNATEKMVSFVVLAFIGLIGAFNIIASLTMMMIEKQRDMRVLVSMGATPRTVRAIFFQEGMLIVLAGTLIGLVLGLGFCLAQQHFGLVPMHDSVVEFYPVKVLAGDLLMIFLAVLGIGLLASSLPLRSLSKRFLQAANSA